MSLRIRKALTFVGKLILGVLVALTVSASPAARLAAQDGGTIGNNFAAVPRTALPLPPLPTAPPDSDSEATARDVRLTSAEIYDRILRGSAWIVVLNGKEIAGHGTGWVLDVERRLVVTNHHVIETGGSVVAFFPVFEGGELNTDPSHYLRYVRPITGTVIDSDRRADLALVQLESVPEGTVALEMADRSPRPGERLHAVGGVPQGSDGVWTYTWGVVRQVNRGLMANGQVAYIVQAQLGINRGNSGGAVVNDRGEVVAVVQGFRTDARDVAMNIDISEVRQYLELALPLVDPQTATDFHRRGERHVEVGRADQAIRDFTAALRFDVTFARAYAGRGWAFLNKGDVQTALGDFEDAIRHDAALAEAYRGRGQIRRAQGKLDEAIEDLTTAIRFEPDSWASYNQRGITYYGAGKFALAVEDFTRAIANNPEYATLYGNRGDALQELGRHQEALEDLQTAIKLDPNNPTFYNLLGVSYYRLGKYGEAVQAYLAANKLDPKNPVYLANTGDALQKLEKHDLAVQAYTGAIGLKSDYAYCYFARGVSLRELGRYDEAVADFDKAIEFDPKTAAYYYQRGLAKWALRSEREAVADFNRAAELDPKNFRPVAERNGGRRAQPVSHQSGTRRPVRTPPSRSGSAGPPPGYYAPVGPPAWAAPPRRGGCCSGRRW